MGDQRRLSRCDPMKLASYKPRESSLIAQLPRCTVKNGYEAKQSEMRLARPCRSIVNTRSTGNHSSSFGTKVAHHDMHTAERGVRLLKMRDCRAAFSDVWCLEGGMCRCGSGHFQGSSRLTAAHICFTGFFLNRRETDAL
ncbi:hypothetical protein PAMA_004785 [Pampus argenteus]